MEQKKIKERKCSVIVLISSQYFCTSIYDEEKHCDCVDILLPMEDEYLSELLKLNIL